MAVNLRTKPRRAAYARRKAIIEPVFGRIDTVHDGKQALLRRGTPRLTARTCLELGRIGAQGADVAATIQRRSTDVANGTGQRGRRGAHTRRARSSLVSRKVAGVALPVFGRCFWRR